MSYSKWKRFCIYVFRLVLVDRMALLITVLKSKEAVYQIKLSHPVSWDQFRSSQQSLKVTNSIAIHDIWCFSVQQISCPSFVTCRTTTRYPTASPVNNISSSTLIQSAFQSSHRDRPRRHKIFSLCSGWCSQFSLEHFLYANLQISWPESMP